MVRKKPTNGTKMRKINYKFLIDQIAEQRAKIHNLENDLDHALTLLAEKSEEIDALKMELYKKRPILRNGIKPFIVIT